MSYSTWPTSADVIARLDSVGVTLRGAKDGSDHRRINSALAAAIAQVEQETKRTFLATDEETRLFDGNGTPALDVDDMVELTSIVVIGNGLTYDVSGAVLLPNPTGPRNRVVVGTGSLPALSTLSQMFPVGRQNISITGRWGYAESIPADLWEAVTGIVAARVTSEAMFNRNDGKGQVVSEKFGDEEIKYKPDDATALSWCYDFAAALKRYKRSDARKRRNLRGRMID